MALQTRIKFQGKMTSQTKKLISNLKKEIESYWDEVREEEVGKSIKADDFSDLEDFENAKLEHSTYGDISYYLKKAQLQFAEKLMKLRDKEEKERLNKLIEKIKKDIKKIWGWNWSPLVKDGVDAVMVELNKILNEALEKCQN